MDYLDFSDAVSDPQFTAYSTMSKKRVCAISKNITIAKLPDGAPGLLLESVRGITPFSKPSPYGLLQMQFTPCDILPSMLSEINLRWPLATIYNPDFNSGYLSIQLAAINGDVISQELEAPMPLTHLPLSRLRLVRKMSMESFKTIKDALESEILLLKAFGIYSIKGFSPRNSLKLSFNPKDLTDFLINNSSERSVKGEITLTDLKKIFSKPLEDLPVKIEQKDHTDPSMVAAGLTDWYCNRFCSLIPPNPGKDEVTFLFGEDARSTGMVNWDLSKPLIAERFTMFTLDALQEAKNLIKEGGMDSIVTETVVDHLPTGFFRLQVFHPFFQIPIGIEQIGIKIEVPENPPLRNQAIHETLAFKKGQERLTVTLRFSPGESVTYNITPYFIYGDTTGTKEVHGESKTYSQQELVISDYFYPLTFISVSCSPNIIEEASLTLHVRTKTGKNLLYQPIVLDTIRPAVILAVLKEEPEEIECYVQAKSLTTENTVDAVFPLPSDQKIDVTTFPQYGSHQLTLRLASSAEELMAIELLPQDLQEVPKNITTVTLGAGKKETTWRWFSTSIFKGGFRYRITGENNGEWSQVLSPLTGTLLLQPKNQTA